MANSTHGAGSRLDNYRKLDQKQDYASALRVIREEIKYPVLTTNEYLADIHAVGISAPP